MQIRYKKRFQKSLLKLPRAIQDKFDNRLSIFLENPFHVLLNNHSIHPTFEFGRSINITGDYRAIYIEHGGIITFTEIGTHSELYD